MKFMKARNKDCWKCTTEAAYMFYHESINYHLCRKCSIEEVETEIKELKEILLYMKGE